MNITKFKYLFNDISFYLNENDALFDKLSLKIDYETHYIIPFREELNMNILNSNNKIDVVKFYLFELMQIQNQFKNNDKKLLFQTPQLNEEFTKYENYIIVSHYLFDLVLTEIQFCCSKYDIDFFLICHNLNLDSTIFDCSVAHSQENKNPISLPKKIDKHENVFSNNGFVLFEHILNEYVKPIGKRGRLSDIHFFYWSMHNNKPQLIHQRPERFKKWFSETYNEEDLGKIKILGDVEDNDRKKHYSNALDWFKTQSF